MSSAYGEFMVNSHFNYSLRAFDFPLFKTNISGVIQVATFISKSDYSNLSTIENTASPTSKVFFGRKQYLFTGYADKSPSTTTIYI